MDDIHGTQDERREHGEGQVTRFRLIYKEGGYKVSVPNIDDCEVVLSSDYDAAQKKLAEAEQRIQELEKQLEQEQEDFMVSERFMHKKKAAELLAKDAQIDALRSASQEQNATIERLSSMEKIVIDLDYSLTHVWQPDYRAFYELFAPRCKEALKAPPVRSESVGEGDNNGKN